MLDVHGDDRLIFYDEDVGCDLLGDLAASLGQQVVQLFLADIEHCGSLGIAEILDR